MLSSLSLLLLLIFIVDRVKAFLCDDEDFELKAPFSMFLFFLSFLFVFSLVFLFSFHSKYTRPLKYVSKRMACVQITHRYSLLYTLHIFWGWSVALFVFKSHYIYYITSRSPSHTELVYFLFLLFTFDYSRVSMIHLHVIHITTTTVLCRLFIFVSRCFNCFFFEFLFFSVMIMFLCERA